METKGISVPHVLIAFNVLFGQPTVVRKRKLHFISIEKLFFRTKDRFKFRQFDFTNAFQVVENFVVFVKQLFFISHILPFAASAGSKMLANRLDSIFRKFMKSNGFTFIIGLSLFKCLNIYYITRHDVWNKNYFSIGRFCN